LVAEAQRNALALHKELLRIGAIEQKQKIRIAILGGVPQRELIGYSFELVGNWAPGKYGLDNFADTIGLTVSTIAPTTKLVFVPLGTESSSLGLGFSANEAEIDALPRPSSTRKCVHGLGLKGSTNAILADQRPGEPVPPKWSA
jgi:hypothetical protein